MSEDDVGEVVAIMVGREEARDFRRWTLRRSIYRWNLYNAGLQVGVAWAFTALASWKHDWWYAVSAIIWAGLAGLTFSLCYSSRETLRQLEKPRV